MNEFLLYKHLCEIENIAAQYTEGQKVCGVIKNTAEQMTSQAYRVAVIGEFKRGKSSLVNALIGADILPTDILPITATVTKVVYGTERKITIKYKSGEIQERTLQELSDFATKYDEEKEKIALSIREIEVQYPSVFCKNHIEILDTPGLNEHESMSAVTLGVIGEIDAAIVVISAREPLSLTEQELISDLIKQSGIRHLVFAVTFIDIMKDEAEKNRVIDFIKIRISNEVLERIIKTAPEIADKARNILISPDIFGVSSRQAVEGFINDNEILLEESRFPKFKEELLALLTAAQSEDLPSKTAEIVNMVADNLPKWKQVDADTMQNRNTELLNNINSMRFYIANARHELIEMFRKMDKELLSKGISGEGISIQKIEQSVLKTFIKKLTSLNSQTYTSDNIRAALTEGSKEAMLLVNNVKKVIEGDICKVMERVNSTFSQMRKNAGLSEEEFERTLQEADSGLPDFKWEKPPVPDMTELRGVDVMPFVRESTEIALENFSSNIVNFISAWRAVLLKQNKKDQFIEKQLAEYERETEALKVKQNVLEFNYSQHIEKLKNIQKNINGRDE